MGTKRRPRTPYQVRAEPALIDSIAHWDRLATGTQGGGESVYHTSCSCCVAFSGCSDCPVASRTGRKACRRTPWLNAMIEYVGFGLGSSKFMAAASLERDYLSETLRLVQLGKVKP